MTSDKKIEGFDEAAASSVGADMACKYASDFVFNASGVYYIQVNSFVDGARWQFAQAQSKIRELEEKITALSCAPSTINNDLQKAFDKASGRAASYQMKNEQLQRKLAELETRNKWLEERFDHVFIHQLEAELQAKNAELEAENNCNMCNTNRAVFKSMSDADSRHIKKLEAESARMRSLLTEWLELRDGEGSQFLGLAASMDFAEKCESHEKRVRAALAEGESK